MLGAALLVSAILTPLLVPSTTAASKYEVLYKFRGGADGELPAAGLIFDPAGNLLGTTSGGGANNAGTVFELTLNADGSWTKSVLYNFAGGTDGASPGAGLIFDPEGNLYGTTFSGGRAYQGTVFELTPKPGGNWEESILYSFCSLSRCRDGSGPVAGLIRDQSGNLYGTTYSNEADGYGVVFQLTQNSDGSWKENVLHQFTGGKDGREPYSGLIFDPSGNLYGTTLSGGNLSYCDGNGCGVAFQLTPNADGSWKESVLHRFTSGKDGSEPRSDLIFDVSGNLYGTTLSGGNPSYCNGNGCGVVFRLTPNPDGSWKESVLHRFTGGKEGNELLASLTFDRAGNLYSTTGLGGNPSSCGGIGCGVVFTLSPDSNGRWREIVQHRFLGHPGAYPFAGVTLDATGNLYGTTLGDGVTTFGSVFQITP